MTLVFKKGYKPSEEHKRKISRALKGRIFSEEHRRKIREARTYKKGWKMSEEHKRKISRALKGRIFSEEHKRKIREARPRQVFTAETRRKISVGNKGKKVSEAARRKISVGNKGKHKMSEEHRRKLILANTGRKISVEHRKKLSTAQYLRFQTQKHPMEGKRHDKATRKLILEARLKQKPMKNTVPEKLMRKMLKDLGIGFEEQIGIKEPACQPDFFIQPNILIFSDGDYIHANPNPHLIPSRGKKIIPGHKPDEILWRDVTAKDMWARDRRITRGLKKEGYKVLRFWHSELETEPEKCLQKIIKIIKESRR